MPGRRGRPQKYGSPSKIVALTLPEDVVNDLQAIHKDLGWAIVRVVEQCHRRGTSMAEMGKRGRLAHEPERVAEVELVSVGSGQALIVVNSAVVRSLPGVQLIPLSETQAFLALDPGKGMADLELAVLDRLEELPEGSRERPAIEALLGKLRRWRRDSQLVFHPRAIILVGSA